MFEALGDKPDELQSQWRFLIPEPRHRAEDKELLLIPPRYLHSRVYGGNSITNKPQQESLQRQV